MFLSPCPKLKHGIWKTLVLAYARLAHLMVPQKLERKKTLSLPNTAPNIGQDIAAKIKSITRPGTEHRAPTPSLVRWWLTTWPTSFGTNGTKNQFVQGQSTNSIPGLLVVDGVTNILWHQGHKKSIRPGTATTPSLV